MKLGRIYNYPLFQELVSMACLGSVLLSALGVWSRLPQTLAVHFDWAGNPNGYGSKGATLALIVFTVLLCWGIDTGVRYGVLLAERERKRFNWLQFLTVPGVMVSAACWFLIVDFNLNGGPFKVNWAASLGWLLVAMGFLLLTEKLRSKADFEARPLILGADLEGELPEKFCLVAHEAPKLWVVSMTAASVLMIVSGVFMLRLPGALLQFSAWATLLGGVICILFSGGFRFVVHHRGVEVASGFLSIPIKSIPVEQIESVEIKEFSALADYGGWGLRYGADNTMAYVVSGNVGVLLRTPGRNYMLSTGQARAFASAIEQLKARLSS